MRWECRERFPHRRLQRQPLVRRSRHAPRHVRHARAVMHVGVANPRWRGKCSRHSRCMRNPQFYVYGKRPMNFAIRSQCRIQSRCCCSGIPNLNIFCGGISRGHQFILWQFCISIDLKKIATTCHSLWGQLMTWYVELYTVYHTLRWMITCILSFIGIWGHWNINEINKIIPISVCLLNNNVVGYVYDRL